MTVQMGRPIWRVLDLTIELKTFQLCSTLIFFATHYSDLWYEILSALGNVHKGRPIFG